MLVETLAGTEVLETTLDLYPEGTLTQDTLVREHRARWERTPDEQRAALNARRRALQQGLDLVPEGWTVQRVFPMAWDLVVHYRIHAPDGMMRAGAAVATRPGPDGPLLGVRPMAHHRDVLQGPAALAGAAALALAAAHV